jgi:TetR/AcrR family transcriptional regulator, tetracycline repressor protein
LGRPRKDEASLDVTRIVEAAWRLVDREGVAALSTRALAAELDVRGPALYWHVKSKRELMGLMIEHALRDSIAVPPKGLSWPEWLRRTAREQRRILLAHRDSGLIAAEAPPTEKIRSEIVPAIMAPLLAAGVSGEEAVGAVGGIAAMVLGWVIYEQHADTGAYMASLAHPDAAFEAALDAFITGLAAKAPVALSA